MSYLNDWWRVFFGGMEYPYTDSCKYNDDWLLDVVKKLVEEFANFVNLNKIKYADPIGWDITRQYEANTVVVDNRTGNAYISSRPVPAGVQINNTHYWTEIYNYANVINTLREQIATNEGDRTTASQDLEVGQLVFVSGLLYEVISPMIAGDSFVVNSNIKKTTIESVIKAIAASIDTVDGRIDDEIDAREQADTALGGRIDDEIDAREQADTALGERINDLVALEKPVRGQILTAFHNRYNAHTEFYLTDDLNRFAPIKWDIEVEDQPNGDTDVLVGRDGDLFYKDGVLYIVTTWSDLSTYGTVIHSSEDLVHWKSHTINLGSLNTRGVIAPTIVEYNDKVYLYGAINQDTTYDNCQLFYAELTTLSHDSIVAGAPTTFTLEVNDVEKSLFDPCLFVYNDILYLAANDKSASYLFANSGNMGQFAYMRTITPYAEGTKLLANTNGTIVGTVQRFHNEAINIYKNYPIDSIAFNIEDEEIRGGDTLRKECEFLESGRFQSAEHGGHIFITPELSQKLCELDIDNVTAFCGTGFTEYINLGDFGTYEASEGGIVHVGALRLVPRTIYGAQSNTSDSRSVAYYHFDVDAIVNPFNLTEFYVVFELASNVTVRLTGSNFNAEFNIPCLPKQRGRAIHFIKSPIFGWTVTDASISELALTGNNAKGYVYGNVCNISVTVTSATAGDTIVSGCPAPWKREYIYPCLVGDDGTVIPCYLGSDGEIKVRSNVSSTARMNLEYICQ